MNDFSNWDVCLWRKGDILGDKNLEPVDKIEENTLNITATNISVDKEIVCDAYVEDCHTPVFLCFDRNKRKCEPYQLSDGYEWCKSHIHHAEKYFCTVENAEISRERVILWC